jgi:DNA-binding NarL/FixJ family response regulator
MSQTRVVVADDDVLLREGLASLLERSGYRVVGRAGDGPRLLALVREHLPDLVVVDILVLSAFVAVEHAMQLLASGRRIGYLLTRRVTDVDDFIDTLERSPSPVLPRSSQMARADRLDLDRNPAAGLAVMRSAKSSSA